MPVNILVIGSDGQLGNEISKRAGKYQGFECFYTTINDLDITSQPQVEAKLKAKNYEYIVNCAAYTDVNRSETDSAIAYKVNADALWIIGQLAKQNNIRVIHVSTDYVFDGTAFKPYKEDDAINPQSVYGKSKLQGETNLMQNQPGSIIIRTSWLYSSFGNNFVKTMMKLGKERNQLNVIYDQVGTPTFAGDLAEAILSILEQSVINTAKFKAGIYHYSNEGVCSWYDFTLSIFKHAAIKTCQVLPIESHQYPSPAPRPHYSVLNKAKIKANFAIEIPHWEDSLSVCIDELLNTNY